MAGAVVEQRILEEHEREGQTPKHLTRLSWCVIVDSWSGEPLGSAHAF